MMNGKRPLNSEGLPYASPSDLTTMMACKASVFMSREARARGIVAVDTSSEIRLKGIEEHARHSKDVRIMR